MEPSDAQYLIINALEILGFLNCMIEILETGILKYQTPTYQGQQSPKLAKFIQLNGFKTMTQTNNIKQQQSRRIGELAEIARQRYLESGGNPHKAANGHDWLSDEEKQEYLTLARQIFDE